MAAISRLVALAIFLLAHYGLDRALQLLYPPNMTHMFEIAQIATSISFLLIYVYLCWDMVTVFIPRLKRPYLARSRATNEEIEP